MRYIALCYLVLTMFITVDISSPQIAVAEPIKEAAIFYVSSFAHAQDNPGGGAEARFYVIRSTPAIIESVTVSSKNPLAVTVSQPLRLSIEPMSGLVSSVTIKNITGTVQLSSPVDASFSCYFNTILPRTVVDVPCGKQFVIRLEAVGQSATNVSYWMPVQIGVVFRNYQ